VLITPSFDIDYSPLKKILLIWRRPLAATEVKISRHRVDHPISRTKKFSRADAAPASLPDGSSNSRFTTQRIRVRDVAMPEENFPMRL
jgi:hypothetical protein